MHNFLFLSFDLTFSLNLCYSSKYDLQLFTTIADLFHIYIFTFLQLLYEFILYAIGYILIDNIFIYILSY